MVTPTDAHGLIAPLNKIVADGIPTVTTVNELSDASGVTAAVAVDNYSAGQRAADYMADAAAGKAVTVAAISFNAGASLAADHELKGFEDGIAKHSNIAYMGPSYVGADAASATQAMNAILARQPDLFGIFDHAGAAAQGILASTRQRGVKPILISGYAANTAEIVQALGTGEVAAIVDFPFQKAGAAALDAAVAAALHKPFEQRQAFSSVIYTQQDAASLGQPCSQ